MIRHAPAVMGLITFACAAGLWWSRATQPELVPGWLVLTILGTVLTGLLLAITPGSSDE